MGRKDNRELVSELFRAGRLRVASNPIDLPPPSGDGISWDRAAGMLVGLAVGDALGNTTESLVPDRRHALVGEVRDYLPNQHAGGRHVGLPSDDTQLAFWTIELLLENGGIEPNQLASHFATRGQIFGLGQTVRAFLRARASARDWLGAAQESAGNGALMRIAPVVLPHIRSPSAALWADALLAGALTHNDYASHASCIAFVRLLWRALHAKPPVRRGFWLDAFVETARRVEGDEPRYVPRAPNYASRRTSVWSFTDKVVCDALSRGTAAVDACNDWYSGAFLLETVPSVLYILERHGNDSEEAIVRAVNDTRDNDTIAAVVGAAVGALHGIDRIPKRWREGLLGRTTHDDDGYVWELIDRARDEWAGRGPTSVAGRRRTRTAFRGCLLGGAVGDALGAPIEFMKSIGEIRTRFGPKGLTDFAPAYGRIGAITDDTQMTLFTADALIRAYHRWLGKGICWPPDVAHKAYLRWFRTQGGTDPNANENPEWDGWLVSVRELHARRAPGTTCLTALESGRMGTRRDRINDSKGCGGVMRIAPVGITADNPFEMGCEFAAITHGHPTGWLAAGYFAQLIHEIASGADVAEAATAAIEPLRKAEEPGEVLAAIERALALARRGDPSPQAVESLGLGWVAEEALAIGLYCGLVAHDFAHGVLLAVNHGGDSDSTGSIAGNILGLIHGERGIPTRWLAQLELREVITKVADDVWLHFGDGRPEGDCDDWPTYPGV